MAINVTKGRGSKRGIGYCTIDVNGTEMDINIGADFNESFFFHEQDIMVAFYKGNSSQNKSVGIVLDKNSNVLFEIPYPKEDWQNKHILPPKILNYLWSSPISDGVKIIFGYSGGMDFWADYGFSKRKYVATGRAY